MCVGGTVREGGGHYGWTSKRGERALCVAFGACYLCRPLAPCISNAARRCSTSPFAHPTAIWSSTQCTILIPARARKQATGAESFTAADIFASFASSSSCTSSRSPCAVMACLPSCCLVLCAFAHLDNDTLPAQIDVCASVPYLMFQKRVLPLSSSETTISLLRNSTRYTDLLRHICRQSYEIFKPSSVLSVISDEIVADLILDQIARCERYAYLLSAEYALQQKKITLSNTIVCFATC